MREGGELNVRVIPKLKVGEAGSPFDEMGWL
jgi:hypothetical protein